MKAVILALVLLVPCQMAYSAEKLSDFLNTDETSRSLRSDSILGVTVFISPVSLPFPLSKGATLYYVANANWLMEMEYMQSTIAVGAFGYDFGEVKEKYYTFQTRYFPNTNSFNLVFGAGYRNLSVNLARDLFELYTQDYSFTVSETETKYIKLGLANQWQWNRGFTLTVDWLDVNIPVSGKVKTSATRFAKDEDARHTIEDAETVLSWYPSGVMFKTSIGFAF